MYALASVHTSLRENSGSKLAQLASRADLFFPHSLISSSICRLCLAGRRPRFALAPTVFNPAWARSESYGASPPSRVILNIDKRLRPGSYGGSQSARHVRRLRHGQSDRPDGPEHGAHSSTFRPICSHRNSSLSQCGRCGSRHPSPCSRGSINRDESPPSHHRSIKQPYIQRSGIQSPTFA